VGTAVASLMTLPFMPEWAWRLCFLLGAILTSISYLMRRTMMETQVFTEMREKKRIVKIPLVEMISLHKIPLLTVTFLSACAYSLLYFTTVYMNSLYGDLFDLPAS